MNVVECTFIGCEETFRTSETLSPNVRFICKNHSRQEHVWVHKRQYDPQKDRKDQDVHFQDHQFEGCDSMAVPLLDEKNLLAGAPDPAKRHVTWTAKRGN